MGPTGNNGSDGADGIDVSHYIHSRDYRKITWGMDDH